MLQTRIFGGGIWRGLPPGNYHGEALPRTACRLREAGGVHVAEVRPKEISEAPYIAESVKSCALTGTGSRIEKNRLGSQGFTVTRGVVSVSKTM